MPCESQPCPVGFVHNPPAPLLGSPPDMRAACSCRPRSCGNTHLCSCGVMAAPTGPHSDSVDGQNNSTHTCAVVAFFSGQQDPIRTQLPTGAQSHSVDSQYLTCGSVASCPRQAPTGLHAQFPPGTPPLLTFRSASALIRSTAGGVRGSLVVVVRICFWLLL